MVNLQKISRRQNHRFDRPEFHVYMNGLRGRSKDWSLGGIAICCDDGTSADLAVDSRISGQLAARQSSERYGFSGRVVRVEPNENLVAFEFSSLSQEAVMMFVQSFRHMISGAA